MKKKRGVVQIKGRQKKFGDEAKKFSRGGKFKILPGRQAP